MRASAKRLPVLPNVRVCACIVALITFTLRSSTKGAAKLVGKTVAERAVAAGIKSVVFDRGGYIYTGRVAEVATGAREAGLDF